MFIRVLLPQPDGPTTVTNSPSSMSRLTWSRARYPPSLTAKSFVTSWKLMLGMGYRRSCQWVSRRSARSSSRSMASPIAPIAMSWTKMVGRS